MRLPLPSCITSIGVLDGAGYHRTSTAAHTSWRAAPGGLRFPCPGGDPASTLTMWRAIAVLTYNVADSAHRKLQ
jgi:hypothetical protein